MSFGGGGTQTTTQEFKPPSWTQPGWNQYVQAGQQISQTPYVQSGLPQVAPLNDYQMTALQMAFDRAAWGAPDVNAARGAAMNAAQGNYANPYAQNVQGIASGQAYNPALEGYFNAANSGPNPYTSPEYVNNLIQSTADQMTNSFRSGTAAQEDAAAAQSGAYGGSADQELKARNAAGLANSIGQMANQALVQQQQYAGNMYNQDFANRMQGLAGYGQLYNADVGNQLAANAQAGGMWNNDISNMLSGSALGLQGGQEDWSSMQHLMNAGNTWNQYYQSLLDSLNNTWNTENQYDAAMNEYLGSVLGRASGSYGTTAVQSPGQNNLMGLLGMGLAGYGMYRL